MDEDGAAETSNRRLHIDDNNDDDNNATTKKDRNRRIPMTEFRILKNVGVIGLAFMCLFTAFASLQNLQSTLNKDEGLGTGGLAVVYGGLVVSSLFLPTFVIAYFGCKWTLALSMICYILYVAANFHAVWGLIIPASVLIGLGGAPLWTSNSTYLTQLAAWYSHLKGVPKDAVINRFFGFFFMSFQTSLIWGNLMSSLIFSQRGENVTDSSDDVELTCGASYYPRKHAINNTNLDRPEITKVYTLLGIYLAFACVAFLVVAIFLDKIELDADKNAEDGKSVSTKLLVETFNQWWRSTPQKMLVPLTMYGGLEQVFLAADYTQSYVACSLGIWNVGYVMLCYGVTNAVSSFLIGRLVQFCGHIPFFVLLLIAHGGVQICLLLWYPDPSQTVVFYVIASVWGVGDAAMQTQLYSFYGYMFSTNTEAAFANYKLWESIGCILAFAYSNFFYTSTKVYICLVLLGVGMSLYFCVEFIDRRQRANTRRENPKTSTL